MILSIFINCLPESYPKGGSTIQQSQKKNRIVLYCKVQDLYCHYTRTRHSKLQTVFTPNEFLLSLELGCPPPFQRVSTLYCTVWFILCKRPRTSAGRNAYGIAPRPDISFWISFFHSESWLSTSQCWNLALDFVFLQFWIVVSFFGKIFENRNHNFKM